MSDDTRAIQFLQARQPALGSDDYTIAVHQQITVPAQAPSSATPYTDTFEQTVTFSVTGPRFRVAPALIESVFPPANGMGEFDAVVPHVVLTDRTLPWQRLPASGATGRQWLALLVFDDTIPSPPAVTGTLADLHHDAQSTLPAGTYSYFDTGAALEFGEAWTDSCVFIDVPVADFLNIAPAHEDLQYLAHVRSILPSATAAVGEEAALERAVIIANRLVSPNDHCTVHLVSLEGLGAILPAGGTAPSGLAGMDHVRLVSLYSWPFHSVDPNSTFTGILETLSVGPLRAICASDGSAAGGYVASGYALGFSLLDHLTRSGKSTVSWYRGPLLPYEAAALPQPPGLALSSDELIQYDPSQGLMDVSYACAWQLGQFIALRDLGASKALYQWKRGQTQAIQTARQTQHMLSRLTGTGEAGIGSLRATLFSRAVSALRNHRA